MDGNESEGHSEDPNQDHEHGPEITDHEDYNRDNFEYGNNTEIKNLSDEKAEDGKKLEDKFQYASVEEVASSLTINEMGWEKVATSGGGDALKRDSQEWVYKDEEGKEKSLTADVAGTAIQERHQAILEDLYSQGYSVSEHAQGDKILREIYFADEKGKISYQIFSKEKNETTEQPILNDEPTKDLYVKAEHSPITTINLNQVLGGTPKQEGAFSFSIFGRQQEQNNLQETNEADEQQTEGFGFNFSFFKQPELALASVGTIETYPQAISTIPQHSSEHFPAPNIESTAGNTTSALNSLTETWSGISLQTIELENVASGTIEALKPETHNTVFEANTLNLISTDTITALTEQNQEKNHQENMDEVTTLPFEGITTLEGASIQQEMDAQVTIAAESAPPAINEGLDYIYREPQVGNGISIEPIRLASRDASHAPAKKNLTTGNFEGQNFREINIFDENSTDHVLSVPENKSSTTVEPNTRSVQLEQLRAPIGQPGMIEKPSLLLRREAEFDEAERFGSGEKSKSGLNKEGAADESKLPHAITKAQVDTIKTELVSDTKTDSIMENNLSLNTSGSPFALSDKNLGTPDKAWDTSSLQKEMEITTDTLTSSTENIDRTINIPPIEFQSSIPETKPAVGQVKEKAEGMQSEQTKIESQSKNTTQQPVVLKPGILSKVNSKLDNSSRVPVKSVKPTATSSIYRGVSRDAQENKQRSTHVAVQRPRPEPAPARQGQIRQNTPARQAPTSESRSPQQLRTIETAEKATERRTSAKTQENYAVQSSVKNVTTIPIRGSVRNQIPIKASTPVVSHSAPRPSATEINRRRANVSPINNQGTSDNEAVEQAPNQRTPAHQKAA